VKLWTDPVKPIPVQQSKQIEHTGPGLPIGVEFIDIEEDGSLWDVVGMDVTDHGSYQNYKTRRHGSGNDWEVDTYPVGDLYEWWLRRKR